ncbi:TRAFs-binding domain-containing protein [Novosphingobium album (ex Hu et al. 2023)]|uniref:DUF4071 domain-containing protein n=1 Tax=Novosphingobium album (ex Hu et al. 2023) TaxID=2930093 RepID=A0ABT0AWJ5_9SPHN|nr:TRAFs-binding domain-containing protein [Novosphingobium album (ex Hu et al. 2023)]MCJ2177184.1 DUF4071 domain-containing protein [Novosphingobium album (ex Hu et al. 2023)]
MDRAQLNSITRLARAGALEQAWAQFLTAGLDTRLDDPNALTVHGRLLKDRAAQADGETRDALLNDAIAAYERASHLSRATYPLINAATLALLAGRRDRAQALALETLALIDSDDCAPETTYWLDATRAEACLLLGRKGEAETILGRAVENQPEAWEDHASTLRQFAMIAAEMGWSADWLDRYRPPPSLHFDGILGIAEDDAEARDAIASALHTIRPGNVVGALAAGADIMVAEEALRLGAHLHVVLPCAPELFLQASVLPLESAWEARFAHLMDEAVSVLILDDWQPLSLASIAIARQAAMGLAIRDARRLQSSAIALRVQEPDQEGPSHDDADWMRHGLELRRVVIERSNLSSAALPSTSQATALLTLPTALARELPSGSKRLASREGLALHSFSTITEGARAAQHLVAQHPNARLGLDYCAVSDASLSVHFDRGLTLSSTDIKGAIALSEAAALALTLQIPAANVEPMGSIRGATGELSIYGLFPDRVSGNQLGK